MVSVVLLCFLLHSAMIGIGKAFNVWKINDFKEEKEIDINSLIKIHLAKAIEENSIANKEELFYIALANIIVECYDKEYSDKKRKGHIIKVLKTLEEEMKKDENPNKVINIDDLPLPKMRQRGPNRIMKIRKKIENAPLRFFGKWPNVLTYDWPTHNS